MSVTEKLKVRKAWTPDPRSHFGVMPAKDEILDHALRVVQSLKDLTVLLYFVNKEKVEFNV